MLSVIMPWVITLSITMLSAVILIVIMLRALALPFKLTYVTKSKSAFCLQDNLDCLGEYPSLATSLKSLVNLHIKQR